MSSRAILASIVTLLMVFIYAPLIVAVLFAFNGGDNLTLPLQGWSLRWFRLLIEDPAFARSISNSAIVAFATACTACVIGAMAAYALARRKTRVYRVIGAFSQVPVMLPPLLIGVSMLATLAALGIPLSLNTVVVGHLVVVVPYVVVIVSAQMQIIDHALEEAAYDLGAAPGEVIRRIVLPLLGTALAGSAILAFAFSFDETLVTTFTAGSEPTLPLFVMSRMRRTIDPSVNAVATVLLVLPWVATLFGAGLIRRTSFSAWQRKKE